LKRFNKVLESAIEEERVFLIKTVVKRGDISETLERIGDTIRKRFSKKNEK